MKIVSTFKEEWLIKRCSIKEYNIMGIMVQFSNYISGEIIHTLYGYIIVQGTYLVMVPPLGPWIIIVELN